MRKNILFFVIALFNQIVFSQTFETISPDNPLIEYTGRIEFANVLKPKFAYSGASVRACFEGTSISVVLNDEGNSNFYNVLIDNNIITRIQTQGGTFSYPITAGLKDTIHEVEIFKLTEVTFGKTQFLGFKIDAGKKLADISDKREHLIEYIGNSITCGYGNEGLNGGSFTSTTENHFFTYAGFTSKAFSARHLAVCKSGIGIYRNYDGPITGSTDCMSNYYQRIFLFDSQPLYKFEQKPDLICIDLGTNDFSTGKGDSALYVSNYLSFIDTLQVKNNNTDIICLLGPMLWGTDLDKVRRYHEFIVDSVNRKFCGKAYFFEMSTQSGDLGLGIDWHPTAAQHLKNAQELINFIKIKKGWTVVNPLTARVADNPVKTLSGLNYQYYEGNWDRMPDFDKLTPVAAGSVTKFDLSVKKVNDYFAIKFTGFIRVPTDGYYTFFTNSDDGSMLYIGNKLVVGNDNLHGTIEQSGIIYLKAGKHAITVNYFDKTGDEVLDVKYAGPNIAKRLIPPSSLSRLEVQFPVNISQTKPYENIVEIYSSSGKQIHLKNIPLNSCIKVVAMDGRISYKETFNTKSEIQMDLSAWNIGIYLVQISNNFNTVVKKVFVY